MLSRLAAFRDDVVFVILLYQMWIYRTDHSRVNEFGQQLTKEEVEALALKEEPKAIDGIRVESKKDI